MQHVVLRGVLSLVSAELAALVQPKRLPRALVSEPYGTYTDYFSSAKKWLYPSPQTLHEWLGQRENTIVRAVLRRENSRQVGVADALGLCDVVLAFVGGEEAVKKEASCPPDVQILSGDLGHDALEDRLTVLQLLEVLWSRG